jgi:hypothetical protein
MAAILLSLGASPIEAHVAAILEERGRWQEYACLAEIIEAESSWDPNAIGDVDRGGSYGLVQRHAPAHGMPPWPWPIVDQIEWALAYADERYGGVCEGVEFRRMEGWW